MGKSLKDLRVATMTFHMANNYGAMLQAYALQKTIENIGMNCEILDYRLHRIYKRDGIYRWKEMIQDSGFFKGNARFVWRHANGRYRNLSPLQKKFDSFMRNDLKLSSKTYFKKDRLSKTDYDAVVFGSDQIWNPERTGGFAPEYLGECFNTERTALIAYAASCGMGYLPENYKDRFAQCLKKFTAVSVREKSLAEYLNRECGIPAKTVLDPVLLADPSIWEPLASQGEIRINEPYLLIYSFDAGDDIYKAALKTAKERNLKPVAICYKKSKVPEGIEKIITAGPKDFLYLMKHADFICTTSFHGLAFSILMEKNFYCMAHPEVGQRERDLISMLGLNDRFLEHFEDLKDVTDCDYSEARKKAAQYREESYRFLEESLKAAADGKSEISINADRSQKKKNTVPVLFTDPHECCGCTACYSVCPQKAIEMKSDEEGFLYPKINEDTCISCAQCIKVCPLKSDDHGHEPLAIYAAKNTDQNRRMSSSSGGVFPLLAGYMEAQGGTVYGAGFGENFTVCHKRAENREEWLEFIGSKYVQSDMGQCFASVKQDLEQGKPVLFSGTPCQIDGLYHFLKTSDTSKLLTCDMICHGVPSPKIWNDWLNLIEKRTGEKIQTICFRVKDTTGWHHSSLNIYGPENKVLLSGTHSENAFSRMFFRHLIIRPACHRCRYADFRRKADITLGDYWGIENQFKDFDDDKGVSLVLCSSDKGIAAWNAIRSMTDSFTVEGSQCEQPSLLHPAEEPKSRKLFWNTYRRYGLNQTMKLFKLVPLSVPEQILIKPVRFFLRKMGRL